MEGIIIPDQVLAQTAQGIATEEFDAFVDAIRAGVTYANVHSTPLFTSLVATMTSLQMGCMRERLQ